MIPETIDRYLKQHHLVFEHSVHRRAVTAQRLAHAEHVRGERVGKVVIVDLDGRLAMAVVSASREVDLERLRAATGATRAALANEDAFSRRCQPCETGAEPALGMFGMSIYADAELTREPWIVMRGGTHEDAIRIDTPRWIATEHVHPVEGLAC
jgi:Ala-tRNA(Pro) deacylase